MDKWVVKIDHDSETEMTSQGDQFIDDKVSQYQQNDGQVLLDRNEVPKIDEGSKSSDTIKSEKIEEIKSKDSLLTDKQNNSNLEQKSAINTKKW